MNTNTTDINTHLTNSIELVFKVLELYKNETVNPTDVINVLSRITEQDRLVAEWAYNKLKGLKKKSINIDNIRIEREKNSKDLAIRLLQTIGSTLPGKKFPNGEEMATTLELTDKKEFIDEYNSTVSKLDRLRQQQKINSMDKSLVMWAWIGRSLAGTLLVFVLFFIGRKLYELVMEIRKSVSNFIMPTRRQLSKFALFTFLGKRKKPRLIPTFVPAADEEDDETVET